MFRLIFALSTLTFASSPRVIAQEDLGTRAKELGVAESRLYDVRVAGSEAKLIKLQHWSNPIDSVLGVLFCWQLEDRPIAVASIYMYTKSPDLLNVEFQSLSRKSFSAKRAGKLLWEPKTAGLEFHKIKTDSHAKDSREQRLVLRNIARTFAASATSLYDGSPTELRLLANPLFQYKTKQGAGAIFSFVEGTDPEVLLLVEAIRQDSATVYRYAVARLSIRELSVRRSGKTVWTVAEHKHPYLRTNGPYSIKQEINVSTQ